MPDKELTDQAIRDSLNNAQFRRVLAWVLEHCDIEGPSFGTSHDSQYTNFREGQRDIGRTLLTKFRKLNPEGVERMFKEDK